MFLLMALVSLILWMSAGTATYRRLGGYRLARVAIAPPTHEPECYARNFKAKGQRCGQFEKCRICHSYLTLANASPGYYTRHWKECGKCSCVDTTGLFESREQALSGILVKSMLGWPGYVGAYAYINASKSYLSHKGEDWSFFVEPKMVQTKTERLAVLSDEVAALEAGLEDIKRRALTA